MNAAALPLLVVGGTLSLVRSMRSAKHVGMLCAGGRLFLVCLSGPRGLRNAGALRLLWD
jgi:hypothetical protein